MTKPPPSRAERRRRSSRARAVLERRVTFEGKARMSVVGAAIGLAVPFGILYAAGWDKAAALSVGAAVMPLGAWGGYVLARSVLTAAPPDTRRARTRAASPILRGATTSGLVGATSIVLYHRLAAAGLVEPSGAAVPLLLGLALLSGGLVAFRVRRLR